MVTKSTLDRLGFRRIQSAGGVDEYRLQVNGLSVLLKEDHSSPAVNFMVLYKCGSRDEGAGTTGSAHFFEHLMFKGTRAFDPLEGNGIMEVFNRVGGVLNANTSYDRTRYFECIPAEHLELAIRIEADRMRGLKNRKSDRDSEMTVVRNEFERNENEPGSALYKEVLAAAFKDHPYHHPVIGARSDVEGIPMDRMVEFYDKFYWPNNATVIIVGKFDSEDALRWIKRYFGRIQKSPKPIPQMYTTEPKQEGERRVELRRAGSLPELLMAWHTVAASHPDTYALDALGHILGNSGNPSSRLYKALSEKGLVSKASAGDTQLRDPGLFLVSASLTTNATLAEVEAIIAAEIERLANEPVSEDELRRAKAANRKGTVMQLDDPMAYTNLLSNAVGVDDWKWSIEYDDNYDKVTAEDIQRVARTYFASTNRTVGHFIPTAGDKKPQQKGEEPKPRKDRQRQQKRIKINAEPVRTDFASRTVRTVLPNGLTVVCLKRGSGAVAVNAAVPAGSYFAPANKRLVASIAANLLTAGTAGYTKEQIGAAVQEMGTGLAFSAERFALKSGRGGSNTGNVLAVEDFGKFVELLAETLMRPTFPEEELRKRLPMFKANVARQLTDTGARAGNTFARALYPEGHPYRPSTIEDTLAQLDALSIEDVRAFYRDAFTPQGSVITVVGDIDPAEALRVIEANFGSWTGAVPKHITIPRIAGPLATPDQPKQVRIAMADKANVDIVIGHATGLYRDGADYYAARIANNALGRSTIADRLGKVVRVKHGLTYGITSSFGDATFGSPSWSINVSVAPENIDRALELIHGVVDEYVREGITDEELEDKVLGACGTQVVGLRTSIGISDALVDFEFLGLGGAGGLDAVVDGFASVTKDKVNDAIKRYFDLSNSVTVLAGTF